jgi:hypothetical protein
VPLRDLGLDGLSAEGPAVEGPGTDGPASGSTSILSSGRLAGMVELRGLLSGVCGLIEDAGRFWAVVRLLGDNAGPGGPSLRVLTIYNIRHVCREVEVV